jgi:GTP cyclohydrolase I
MEDKIKDIISHIGANAYREGLLETPARVVKSWKELYSGYNKTQRVYSKPLKTKDSIIWLSVRI